MSGAPGALIVGGAHVSLGVARSLGRRGVPVWLMANHPLPTYSRYVRRSFAWPGAEHPDGVASIMDIAARHHLDGWVLLATGDQDMRMIAQSRAQFASRFRVPTPAWRLIIPRLHSFCTAWRTAYRLRFHVSHSSASVGRSSPTGGLSLRMSCISVRARSTWRGWVVAKAASTASSWITVMATVAGKCSQ